MSGGAPREERNVRRPLQQRNQARANLGDAKIDDDGLTCVKLSANAVHRLGGAQAGRGWLACFRRSHPTQATGLSRDIAGLAATRTDILCAFA